MRQFFLILFLMVTLSYSCSSDGDVIIEPVVESVDETDDETDSGEDAADDEESSEEDADDDEAGDDEDTADDEESSEEDADDGETGEDEDADNGEEEDMEEDTADEGMNGDDDSSDEDAGDEDMDAIVGVWDLTDIDFDGDNAGVQTTLLVGFLEELIDDGCETIILDFNQDRSLTIERKDFSSALGGNFSVSCPEDVIIENAVWDINEMDLIVTFDDGTTRTFIVEIEGDTAFVDGSIVNLFGDVVPEEELGDTRAIFTRR